MDENSKEKLEAEGGQEQQVVFFAPELLQAAQQRSERLELLRDAADALRAGALSPLELWRMGWLLAIAALALYRALRRGKKQEKE